MARRNTRIPPRSQPRQMNLDRIQDTSDTVRNTAPEQVSPNYTQSQSVPPPFSGEAVASPFITRSEFALFWKIVKIIGGLFLPVATIIWYAASIYFNVDNLQKDVKEVKDKTQILIENNITQDFKLNSLELSVTNVKVQVDSQMQKGSHNRVPNK